MTLPRHPKTTAREWHLWRHGWFAAHAANWRALATRDQDHGYLRAARTARTNSREYAASSREALADFHLAKATPEAPHP